MRIDYLKNRKNLLAFSSGIDSTALFFMLIEKKIKFDIVIVNYGMREESKEELEYAKELALRYDKKIYIKNVQLKTSNFEKNARDIRYRFFEEIIEKNGYQNLLTAHQLNDKLEWFLMQLSKGAGVVELLGFEEFEKRESYNLIRPLINYSKDELLNFLEEKKIKYFIDSSNFEIKYKRNYFRKNFSNRFIQEYKEGLKKSFEYLQIDKLELLNIKILHNEKDFFVLKEGKSDIESIRIIDKILKKLGLLLSSSQKKEILKTKDCVIGGKIAISFSNKKIFIAPYIKKKMDKKFKEKCRLSKIPAKIRGYLNLHLLSITN